MSVIDAFERGCKWLLILVGLLLLVALGFGAFVVAHADVGVL